MTTRFDATCPQCGYAMDSHSAVGDEDVTPSPGDLSICLACGDILAYTGFLGALSLRRTTPAERDAALADPVVVKTLLAHRQAVERSPDWPQGPNQR